jgi:hypothetical protein
MRDKQRLTTRSILNYRERRVPSSNLYDPGFLGSVDDRGRITGGLVARLLRTTVSKSPSEVLTTGTKGRSVSDITAEVFTAALGWPNTASLYDLAVASATEAIAHEADICGSVGSRKGTCRRSRSCVLRVSLSDLSCCTSQPSLVIITNQGLHKLQGTDAIGADSFQLRAE